MERYSNAETTKRVSGKNTEVHKDMRRLKNETVTVGVDTCVVIPIHQRFLRGKMRDFTIKTLAVMAILVEILEVVAVMAWWWEI